MYLKCINKLNNNLLTNKFRLFVWRLCSNQINVSDPLSFEPYSSLYVNSRYAKRVYKVIKPLIDYRDLHLIIANIHIIKQNYIKRNINYDDINFEDTIDKIGLLIDYRKQLEPLRKLREKYWKHLSKSKKPLDEQPLELKLKYEELINKMDVLYELAWNLEESVIPFVLNIPNDVRVDVKTTKSYSNDDVVKSFHCKPLSKLNLDYIRLAYINKCLYKSIIGPHSTYLVGIGAQLHMCLSQYFYDIISENNFYDISSVDFAKSAIVEACNSNDVKHYKNDELTIDRGYDYTEHNQCVHLVGNCSLESICALLSQTTIEWSADTIRFITCGNHYLTSLEQTNIIQTISITQNNIQSDNEMDFLCDIIWKCLIKLGICCRMVKCNAQQLHRNQYCRFQIEVLLNSSSKWITVSQIINYQNYVSLRLGLKQMHIIEAKIDPYPIILSLLEHKQSFDGSIQIPECLKQYLIKE